MDQFTAALAAKLPRPDEDQLAGALAAKLPKLDKDRLAGALAARLPAGISGAGVHWTSPRAPRERGKCIRKCIGGSAVDARDPEDRCPHG